MSELRRLDKIFRITQPRPIPSLGVAPAPTTRVIQYVSSLMVNNENIASPRVMTTNLP